jgi:hypothetical protein
MLHDVAGMIVTCKSYNLPKSIINTTKIVTFGDTSMYIARKCFIFVTSLVIVGEPIST